MKKIVLSMFLASAISFAFAQKSEVKEAQKTWEFYYSLGRAKTPEKKLEDLKNVIAHTDKAIADEKSKVMPEAWIYRALASAEIAVSDTSNLANINANLAIAEEALAKVKALDTKDEQKDYVKAVKATIEVAVRNAGIIAYQKKEYKIAYDKFVESTVINPLDTAMYLNAGIAANGLKDYPNTVKYFKKAIDLGSPQSKELYNQIIQINLAEQKDTTAALATLETAIAKYPENGDFLKTQTQIYLNRGDAEKSLAMLTALAVKEPNNATYQILLGNISFSQALKLQEERNKLDIKKVKEFQAATAKMKGLLETALPFYKKALEIDPVNRPALETLKTIYAFKNDTKSYDEIKKRFDALPKE
ncbi:tetratricopeptide repeat protein [Pedobacter changchengzhani]|uniref:Tetratricopeptide repeat protein n=1 Tax=Pedobacter changchengzhani TaxID=2529274 RepID=A0A4R5MJD4_9SPHI|nr:tetratricopeptide repeat protein [Pedobacter changchengzhani]TDG35658.1 tetratricopeptide repeat protein [Pedobacter changchengzhani]